MSPVEKAKELIEKFGHAAGTHMNDLVLGMAKRSAFICADEIIEALKESITREEQFEYWQQVKAEINIL